MKAPLHSLIAALVLGGISTGYGQAATLPKTELKPAAEPESDAAQPAPPTTFSTNTTLVSVFSDETLRQLGINPNTKVVSVMTNRMDLIEGQRTRIEGGLVPLIRRPSLVTFLQLFNPFAPEEYGGMSAGTPDQGFSRAFADPIKTQPAAPLFLVGDKPVKADTKPKSGEAQ